MLHLFLFIVGLLAAAASTAQSSTPARLTRTIQFVTDWCPGERELLEMSKHMSIWRNGCCVQSAILNIEAFEDQSVVAKWVPRIYEGNNFGKPCIGQVLSDDDLEIRDREKQQVAVAAEDQARKDERALEATNRARIPGVLRGQAQAEFCATYGRVLRTGVIEGVGRFPEALSSAKTEAHKRGVKINETLAKAQSISIGTNECDLYASLGVPTQQNRTVTASGTRIQHVYGRRNLFVYTVNGRVVAWQD